MTSLPRSRAFRAWFQFSTFAVIQYGGMLKQHVTCRFVRFTYLRSKVLCGIQIVWEHLCCRRKSCAEIWSWREYRARYKYYLASQTTYYTVRRLYRSVMDTEISECPNSCCELTDWLLTKVATPTTMSADKGAVKLDQKYFYTSDDFTWHCIVSDEEQNEYVFTKVKVHFWFRET